VKRYPEIERKILLHVEQLPAFTELFPGQLPGYEDRVADVEQSIEMLRRDGALMPPREGRGSGLVEATAITPRGYDVLRQVASDSGWQKAIEFAKRKGLDIGTAGLTTVVVELIKSGV
jgi:hypothetical protein